MSKKYDEVVNKLRAATGWDLLQIDAEEIMPIIASAVEEAYKQGANDMLTTRFDKNNPQPTRLYGLTSGRNGDKPSEIQLITVASLYAKEHGFKL